MNKKELDALFKNKLQNATRKPSEEAWDKLSGRLQQKKKGNALIWLRVAAAVVLIAGVSWVIVKMDLTSGSKTNVVVQVDSVEKVQPIAPEVQLAQQEDVIPEINLQPERKVTETVIAKRNKKPVNKETKVKEEIQIAEIKIDTSAKKQEVFPIELPQNEELIAQNKTTSDLPEVTIIYKRGSKLQQNIASADTIQTEKKSALEKIWNVAREIKNGELGIADIRSTKDELLAFETRKPKNQK